MDSNLVWIQRLLFPGQMPWCHNAWAQNTCGTATDTEVGDFCAPRAEFSPHVYPDRSTESSTGCLSELSEKLQHWQTIPFHHEEAGRKKHGNQIVWVCTFLLQVPNFLFLNNNNKLSSSKALGTSVRIKLWTCVFCKVIKKSGLQLSFDNW